VPEEGIFIVGGSGESVRLLAEEEAFSLARERAIGAALHAAHLSGADEPAVTLAELIEAPEIEGQRKLVEARFTATATGRPRIAIDQ